MDNPRIITISLNIDRRTVFFLVTAFFLSWRPGYLGSETLTLTTYYPAPYGGYVNLLTTGQTLLARDGGNVGIGTGATAPIDRLTVSGTGTAISALDGGVRNRFFSSSAAGGGYVGTSSNHPLRLRTNDSDRITIASGGEVQVAGNMRVAGYILGQCTTKSYTTSNGTSFCDAGQTIFQTFGNGVVQEYGYLSSAGGTPSGRIGIGADWNGTMMCCRMN